MYLRAINIMSLGYAKKTIALLVALASTLAIFVAGGFAFADTPTPPPIPLPQTSIFETLTAILERVLQILLVFGGAAAALLILIAAFYFLTAAGSPVRREKAKEILLWTVVGYGIIVSARLIINVVVNMFGGL